MGQGANGLPCKQRVSIEGDYYFTVGISQSHIERRGFAAVGRREKPYAFVLREILADDLARLIQRPIINHDDFVVFIV